MGFPPIEDHGIIGDLYTAALVGTDGAIDFLCFPRFDSPTIFARLLDVENGGCFSISPRMDGARRKQLYLPDSNILLTRFLSDGGVAEISDFMPIEEAAPAHNLVRRVKTVVGEVRYRMVCDPRFDYGRAKHRVETANGHAHFVPESRSLPTLRLCSGVPVTTRDGRVEAEFTLKAGEHVAFVLESAEPGVETPCGASGYVSQAFKDTLNAWRRWVSRCKYGGRWQSAVHRSALALKLLVSTEHGSIVAAPTFGLPEATGGARNWDYRYTWIRDAALTITCLMRLGYIDEAEAFMRWIEANCREEPLQALYGLDGRRELTEEELSHWSGYADSRPVLIGNDAHRQLQLDVYGELVDAVAFFDEHVEPIHHDFWKGVHGHVDWVCANWRRPDNGIWEVRGGVHEFVQSRVMCWVALDRGLRIARHRSLPAPVERWTKTRDEVYRSIHEEFWDEGLESFVRHKGARHVDASMLRMPLVRFTAATDPRWIGTMCAIEKELVEDSLVYRYRDEAEPHDRFGSPEGTFSICTFWFVECLALAGDLQRARFVFEKMLGYANHVGLYAEELGRRGEHLGNFPQAFTHLGLVSAALELDRRLEQTGSLE